MSAETTAAHADKRQMIGVAALVGAGALTALLDDAAPTGSSGIDGLWRFTLGGLIVACGALAPPVAWVLTATLAAVSSAEPILIVIGVLSIGAAGVGALKFPEYQLPGAAVGYGASIIVFRLPHESPLGMATLVAAIVVAPIAIGGVYYGPWLFVRTLSIAGVVLFTLAFIGSGASVWAALDARGDVNAATAEIDRSVEQFRNGNEATAQRILGDAIESLESANETVTKPWLGLSKFVPVVGHQIAALQTLTAEGLDTANAALAVLEDLDRSALTIDAGSIDVEAVSDLEPVVIEFAEVTESSAAAIDGLDSPWLLEPLSDAVEDAQVEMAKVSKQATRAADAVQLAPDMFGASGPRNHLVLFATPAELRGTVGLVGNWALLEANAGALGLVSVGRADDLSIPPGQSGSRLTEPAEYVERYGAVETAASYPDITLSPDFPNVASVGAQLFEESTGIAVDTVLLADPHVMAAFLEITGPITVAQITVSAENALDFLLLGQYEQFPSNEARVAFLGQLLAATFTELLRVDFPDPWDLDEVFAEVVKEERLVIAALDPDEQELLTDLGIDGGFPDSEGDLLSVITQNAGQNKIDTFLQRQISYDVTVDAFDGRVDSVLTVDLTNMADDPNLPAPVIGNNDQGFPLGTNVSEVTVYSPLVLEDATVDGETVGFQGFEQFGVRGYSALVEIAPGATATVVLEFSGPLDLSERYFLRMPVQPTVLPDQIELRVTALDEVELSGRLTPWTETVTTSADLELNLELAPGG